MKKPLGDLLLLAGIITASLAAAESRRVSRAAPVDDGLLGEVLHATTRTRYEAADPDLILLQDQELLAGTEIGKAELSWLRSHGFREVSVLRQRVTSEARAVDPDLIGRVLATPVRLREEVESVRAGRRISEAFARRLQEDSSLFSVAVIADLPGDGGAVRRERLDWSLRGQAENPVGVSLVGSTLAQEVGLPVELRAQTYIDEDLLDRLEQSEVQEVVVRVPREFTWSGWGQRWTFLVGVLMTLTGVLLKRSRSDDGARERELQAVEHLSGLLTGLEGAVERLQLQADELSAEELHAAVDPLLSGPVYQLGEGSEVLRQAHGTRVHATVMAAFARGERNLNRAWSASVDGHAPEACASLGLALPAIREAREALPGSMAPTPAAFGAGDPATPLPPDVPLGGGAESWLSDES